MSNRLTGAYVDAFGYLYVDGLKIAQVVNVGGAVNLIFYDKDKRRSSCRNSCYVSVSLTELATVCGDNDSIDLSV